MSGPPVIDLSGVEKWFYEHSSRAVQAICPLDFRVEPGDVVALQGPSGSGKTTLLRLIAGMIRPTRGRIRILGREIGTMPPAMAARFRRDTVGFVFQEACLIHGLSVLENVMVPGLPTGRPRKELRSAAEELLDRFGLSGFAGRKADLLSGGEKQRVALARALINRPEILLADEPTAHLDGDMADRFMETVVGLKQEGRTLVIGTHDPLVYGHDAVDRQVVLRRGRLSAGIGEAG